MTNISKLSFGEIQPAARVQLPPTGLTPVANYAQLIRERSELRGWRLGNKTLNAFERQAQQHPGHAGQLQPTSITVWLGRDLAHNWAEAMAWLRDGLEALGYSLREYFTPDQLSLYQADSPTRKGLCLAELDLARHWDREYGLVPREVRQKAARWPGLEDAWLLALNPVLATQIDYKKVPGLFAPGLVVGSGRLPVFHRDGHEVWVNDDWDDYRWDDCSVVSFTE